ncbi:hypothetical protein [Corynebacterium suicordis]|uniref:HNH nuclease domain-containing protein n=1 Tax=Corynebacterium suicordis DSM 45110 TaxID=1121369 RepID=A0ABR9ZLS5_9CORY|nr:hypothetical protein [Corynebacterium suicordis]MBF4554391.1 hypothetical protein [Corynebacterium suicordis DSM 45110]MDR6278584.1 hypothetical protein [Corynebacterium suicordis]
MTSSKRALPDAPPSQTVESFWNKVVKDPGDGHWIFTGAISSPDGYGRVSFRQVGKSVAISAHRFALWISGCDITDSEMVAEHRCNEPLCVRVDDQHLIPSTRAENIRYASLTRRLRGPKGGADAGWRTRYQRSIDVRAAVRDGWNEEDYLGAARPVSNPLDEPTLF